MIQSLSFPPSLTLANSSSAFRCRATVAPPPPKQAAPRKLSSGTLYEVLRVKHTASIVEIKGAYRTLAKLYHPDATRSSSSSLTFDSDGCGDFIEIHKAYETLSDPAARALYDLSMGLRFGPNIRLTVAAFRGYPIGRRRPFRRWETDQCW